MVVKTVATDAGKLEVAFTKGDHAHVSTPSGERIAVRTKHYYVSVHLFLVDGVWQLSIDSRPHITRDAKTYRESCEVAPTVRTKLVEMCREALATALEAQPDALVEAEAGYRLSEVNRLHRERTALLAKAHDLAQKEAEQRELLSRVDPDAKYGVPVGSLS